MIIKNSKIHKRNLRHARVKSRVLGSLERPRLSVFRSLKYTYAQIIDDSSGKTLANADTRELKGKKGESSLELGKLIAERAKKAGVKQVVFDRGGYKYHGRVKAVADGARDAGLQF